MRTSNTQELAIAAFNKHLVIHGNFDHYSGILSMHGLARVATEGQDEFLIQEIREHILPYVEGKRLFPSKFPNYNCGGNAASWLFYRGCLPEASEVIRCYAEQIIHDAPRSETGILCHPDLPGEDVIWIDIAFAITPFLLYAGLGLGEEIYLEEAYQQTAMIADLLENRETGLFFQCINTLRPGHITEDHWSRGNGWAALALAELAVYLPRNHPRKKNAIERFQNHLRACFEYQDQDGLWHQEMTRADSYVETSGSGLLLYALGQGLLAGLVDSGEAWRFQRGLEGLLAYISDDIDIFHTCQGCRCPGQGTQLDYMAQPPVMNDMHAFGPIIFAMGQGHLMGIESICRSGTVSPPAASNYATVEG